MADPAPRTRRLAPRGTIDGLLGRGAAAFADPSVAGVLTVIGGFNVNDRLPHLDWDPVAEHPKVLCGYSDITALQAAVLARTGLVTYSGPHWSTLLQGTPSMPSLDGAVLMLEDDAGSDPPTFARDLASLLQLPDAGGVRGLVAGRFQRASGMTRDLLAHIVAAQPRLRGLPVLANADFGHTSPMATIPIGGWADVVVDGGRSALSVAPVGPSD